MHRVKVYIDGLNLFHGLRSKRKGLRGSRWPCYYWLNLGILARNLVRPGQELIEICYFTARVYHDPEDPDKLKDQNTYLDALGTVGNLSIIEGYFVPRHRVCNRCGNQLLSYEEKLTDVNIATAMLCDAYADEFDTAILISGDADLATPVKEILAKFPDKRIVAAFPPDRVSKRLRQVATAYFSIGRGVCSRSLFPDRVKKSDGYVLTRPANWV